MTLLVTLSVLLLSQSSNLEEADRLKAQGKLFRAEGFYLAEEPQAEHVFRVAQSLSELSLRIGNTETRRQFYRGYLTKSKNWRGVAAIVLATLAADREAYDEFAEVAEIALVDYPLQHPLRWRLLYHLARYTTLDPAKLALNENEQAWFESLRTLDAHSLLPAGKVVERLPADLRNLCLIEHSELSPASEQPYDEVRYTAMLAQLSHALSHQDLSEAAALINQLTPMDAQLSRSDLSIFFYPLIAQFFELRQELDRAERARQNLTLARSYAVLPFIAHPNLIKAQAPHPEVAPDLPAAQEPEPAPIAVVEPVSTQAQNPSEPTAPSPEPAEEPTPTAEPAEEPTPTPEPAEEPTPIAEPAEEPTPTAGVLTPETTASQETNQPLPVEESRPNVQASESYEELEKRLLEGSRNLELRVRGLEPSTSYRKIFRNYLFGLSFINTSRYPDALDRLSVAAAQISELPFPLLEAKIMMALALAYERQDSPDKATWYRLQAMQLWNAPENLPFMTVERNPLLPAHVILDRALAARNQADSIYQLLHYSETAAFYLLRQRAYQRGALCDNSLLEQQLAQVGDQLAQQVAALADSPNHEPNPRRYNEALDLWSRLWTQTIPYYHRVETPSVQELQRALGTRDRIVSFIEGQSQLGVLLISKTQAFGMSLGDKNAFLALNEDERMGFLVGRLGSLWEGEGTLFLALSPTWRNANLTANLRRKMADASKLCLIFSIKSFVAEKSRGTCSGTLYLGQESLPETSGAVEGLQTIPLEGLESSELATLVERNGHLIYYGPLHASAEGLKIGAPNDQLALHDLSHYRATLCSITLIAQAPLDWGPLLDELELVYPSTAIAFNIVESPASLKNLPTEAAGSGIRIY